MGINDLSQNLLNRFSSLSEELKEMINMRIKMIKEERRKYNRELLDSAKPREELIVPLNCYVLSAAEIYPEVGLSARSELEMEAIPSYHNGRQASLELMVDCPRYPSLKTILFNGNPAIETDYQIKAYVFLGEARYLKEGEDISDLSKLREMFHQLSKQGRPFYLSRLIQEKERALKIEKLRGHQILKTYVDLSFKFPC